MSEQERDLTEQEIDDKAKELAQKIYSDNKKMIDETLDDSKEVYSESKIDNNYKPKKKKHILLKLFGIAAIILILILIVSNVISSANAILEKTNNQYLYYGFYVLIFLLVLFLIIIPSFEIFSLPSYKSLFSIEDNGKKEKVIANTKKIMLIAKKHSNEWLVKAKQAEIDKYNEAINTLKNSNEPKELKKAYHYINRKYIRQDVLKIITGHANKVFISTTVIQEGKLDSLVLFTSYVRMAKDVLKYCGFRISFVRLCKLSIHVLASMLASSKLGDVDFSAILPNAIMEPLYNIPGAKVVVNSLSDGVANALMFYKVGVVLEESLLSDNQNPVYQFAVAMKETAKYMLIGMLVEIIKKIFEFSKYVIKSAISGISSFFTSLVDQIKPKKLEKVKE